jgi:hypothetical protein
MLAWHAQPCERALMATAGTDCEGGGAHRERECGDHRDTERYVDALEHLTVRIDTVATERPA